MLVVAVGRGLVRRRDPVAVLALVGALVGGALLGGLLVRAEEGPGWVRIAVPVVVLLSAPSAAGMAGAGATAAVRLLRRPLAEAASVESLRTA